MRQAWHDNIYLSRYSKTKNRGPGVCEYGTGLFKESVRPKYKLEFCRIKNDLLCRVCVMYGTGTY